MSLIRNIIYITFSIFIASSFICQEAKKDMKFLQTEDTLETFQEYMSYHGKSYATIDEFNKRYNAFKANYETSIEKKVQKLSKFMDITKEEFKKKYLNLKIKDFKIQSGDTETIKDKEESNNEKSGRNLQSLPSSFDWRDKGVVSSIKDQGECGCCWAFSAVANIESQYAIQNSRILDLSEEQLLDCDSGNDGCNGGIMDQAFKYIKNAGGLMSEADYRYTQNKDTCRFKKNKAVIKVTGWSIAGSKNEETIKKMLVNTGPLAVAVNADNMQNYSGGIISDSQSDCPSSNINHAVNLVGYGEDNGEKFWIVKNSWGENWGENGYFRIARGKGTCGINEYVVSAQIN
jgi:cathepsin F